MITSNAMMNEGEIPKATGLDSQANESPMYAVREPVIWYATPRAISSTPRDTMNDGMSHAKVMEPVIVPANAAQPMPSTAAGNTLQPQPRIATLTADAARAGTEPTDRSMPPMISTKVMPTANTIRSGIWLARVLKVSYERKWSLRNENNAIIASKAPAKP